MSINNRTALTRREFLTRSMVAASALALPYGVPASVLGRNGTVRPSDRIVMGGIGLGGRGSSDLQWTLNESDVQWVAVCDTRKGQRLAAKKAVDAKYGNTDCVAYADMRQLLAERNGCRCRADRHRRPLARAGVGSGHAGRQGCLLRKARVPDDGAGADGRRDRPPLRPDLSNRRPAAQRSQSCLRHRNGPIRPLGPDPYRVCRLSMARRPASRLAPGRTGTGQRRVRLGSVAGALSLAAVQRRAMSTAAGGITSTIWPPMSPCGARTPLPRPWPGWI